MRGNSFFSVYSNCFNLDIRKFDQPKLFRYVFVRNFYGRVSPDSSTYLVSWFPPSDTAPLIKLLWASEKLTAIDQVWRYFAWR
mmetsp:Transcript_2025/g.2650  ORF Transcript_2025/g.2650 Transcript_2025/m.2650 type:complete len:83 (+) Transcript_2025:51-299(+)